MNRQPHTLRFGAFKADLRSHELWKRGVRVSLQDQPFQVLAALLEQPDQLITRDELQNLLWPDVIVDKEVGLNNAVRKLRDALDLNTRLLWTLFTEPTISLATGPSREIMNRRSCSCGVL